MCNGGNRFALGAVNRHLEFPQQPGIPTHMVVVMVSVENRDELKFFMPQVVQYRRGIARIDHSRMTVIADDPDVIVAKGANRDDVRSSHDSRRLFTSGISNGNTISVNCCGWLSGP